MLDLKKYALVRYVSRNNAAPKLGLLIPHKTLNYSCFFLMILPT
jgi:hypothetical protein